jgi:hypothetical protein
MFSPAREILARGGTARIALPIRSDKAGSIFGNPHTKEKKGAAYGWLPVKNLHNARLGA